MNGRKALDILFNPVETCYSRDSNSKKLWQCAKLGASAVYECKLDVVIFTLGPVLPEIVRSAVPLEHYEHHIEVFDAFSAAAASRADILLLDLPAEGGTDELRRLCKPRAALIACLPAPAAAALADGELAALDDVWVTPLEPRLAALRLRRLLERIKLEKDCWLTRLYLDTTIDSIPDMVWFKAKDGTHVKVNKAFCHTVGKTWEDVTGKDHCYIWDVSREDFERGEFVCRETEELVMQRRATCQFTEKVKSQHGMRQFKTYKSPLIDESGEIMGTVGIGHDETDLENMGAELEIILRSMPFAILVWDDKGIIVNANEKFESYFGVRRDEIVGRRHDMWEADHAGVKTRPGEDGRLEIRVAPSDAREERILKTHLEPIYDVFHTEVGRLCIFRDVTVERALERQLIQNLNTDFLTGLCNRRHFYHYMADERSGRPVSLLYLDLDRFKEVNDTYGHQVGDQALIETARLLRESFPEAFIARLGGDEFIIALLGDQPLPALRDRAHTFQRRMEETFSAMPRFRLLSACIGVARSGDPDMDIDTLLQQSDAALYAAKERGMGQCCVFGE